MFGLAIIQYCLYLPQFQGQTSFIVKPSVFLFLLSELWSLLEYHTIMLIRFCKI